MAKLAGTSYDFRTNNFDLIRIVTAFLVLVNHSLAHLQLDVPEWYTVVKQFQRVPMFFVMSGFLLSASFERNDSLVPYFRNRLSRIYPGLWVCLLLTIVIYSIVGANFVHASALPWFFAQAVGLIYTPAFLNDFGYGSYNGSLWTIVVELQFYLILPVIYFIYKRFSPKRTSSTFFYILFGLSFLLALALKLYPPTFFGGIGKLIRYSFLPHIYIFMAGILLQRLEVWKWNIIRGKALWWMAAFLLVVYTVPQTAIISMLAMIILAFCTISLGYSAPGVAKKLLKDRDISYGVYMYHGMLLSILVEVNVIGNVWLLIGVALLTFVLAWLSYNLIEAPAMKRAKSFNKKYEAKAKARAKQQEQNILTPVHNYIPAVH